MTSDINKERGVALCFVGFWKEVKLKFLAFELKFA